MDGDHAQPVKQIFPEPAFLDGLLQFLVGGGQDSGIHPDFLPAPNPLDGVFLQETQEFDLQGRGDFADFIQKEGALVSGLDAPHHLGMGARERPFFVAEKLAFQKSFREWPHS